VGQVHYRLPPRHCLSGIESSRPSSLQRAEIFAASRGGLEKGGGERLLAELDGRAQDGVSQLGDPPAARAGNFRDQAVKVKP
jgi:hypothetical protein